MDAYFAAVEQRDFPQLRGKPVIVGGDPGSRGVVATASYEARKYGIHSAMASATALRLCPQAIFVKPRFSVYKKVSGEIRAIFYEYTDLVEPLSLDEAFLDVTENKKEISSATIIAREILDSIYKKTGLTASAGVAPNKFVAKIASDIQKPSGLTVISPEKVEKFIAELPIGKFYGVGKKTEEKMKKLGIYTGKQLRQWPLEELIRHFGKAGHYFYQVARGIDKRPVMPHRERKSIGVENTFRKDLRNRNEYLAELNKISAELAKRIKAKNSGGYTLTLKLKDNNFRVSSKQHTFSHIIMDADEIYSIAQRLLNELLPRPRPVRLLGLSVHNLLTNEDDKEFEQLELPF
jgi:DNA polymerase-4